MTYATHWLYSPERRAYPSNGYHHLITGRAGNGQRITLAEVEMNRDANLDPRMSETEAAQIARVMAAGLEMLRTLRAIEQRAKVYPDDNDTDRLRDLRHILANARRAIAKAEGQE